MNQALLSSKNMNWCTPQDFFDKLDLEFGFTLDAAATDKSAKCQRYYTPEMDGLAQSWQCDGAVFCNPPYGRQLGKWVRKAWQEAQTGQTIVLLIPARTDTAYFHDFIYGKAEIRFLRGRLRFTDENGNASDSAPFPSMVVVYNRNDYDILKQDIEALRDENKALRSGYANMWFAHRNADPEMPHPYETAAEEEAERLLGDWKTVMMAQYGPKPDLSWFKGEGEDNES